MGSVTFAQRVEGGFLRRREDLLQLTGFAQEGRRQVRGYRYVAMYGMHRPVQGIRQRGTETQDLSVERRRLVEGVRRIKRRQDHGLAIRARTLDEQYRHRACAQQLPVCVAQQPRQVVCRGVVRGDDEVGTEVRCRANDGLVPRGSPIRRRS